MHHKNIAQLYEVLSSESKIYMITELCTGGEAFDYIVTHGKLSEDTCKPVFRQIVDAVSYCHEKNYVHRDLKLENILFQGAGDPQSPLFVKLIDFGFTKEFKSDRLLDTYCGSVAYAAPEIVEGKKYSGPAADIWSLGVILFTLLCGYLPFDDDNQNEAEIQKRILSCEYEIPAFLSKDAADLISKIFITTQSSRISISDLLEHPFLKETSEGSQPEPKITPATSFTSEEEQLLSNMELLGFDVEEMISSIKNHACNQSSALFYLLLKSREQLIQRVSDTRISPLLPAITSTTFNSLRTVTLGARPPLNMAVRGAGGLRSAGIKSESLRSPRSPRLTPKAAHISEEEDEGRTGWDLGDGGMTEIAVVAKKIGD